MAAFRSASWRLGLAYCSTGRWVGITVDRGGTAGEGQRVGAGTGLGGGRRGRLDGKEGRGRFGTALLIAVFVVGFVPEVRQLN